jgi:hypothetical protein
MILRTKIPDSCADLCPAKVERTLEKHFSDIYAAARELGVPGPDLRRLTWAQPSLLENALEEHELAVQRAMGEVIQALHSDDPRRRMWAREKNHVFLQGAESSFRASPLWREALCPNATVALYSLPFGARSTRPCR